MLCLADGSDWAMTIMGLGLIAMWLAPEVMVFLLAWKYGDVLENKPWDEDKEKSAEE